MTIAPTAHGDKETRPRPTVNFSFNKDIFLTDGAANQYPNCLPALDYVPLCEEFDKVDVIATNNKKRFQVCGMFALVLTAFALTGIAIESCFLGFGSHAIPKWATLVFESAAVTGLLLYMLTRTMRFKDKWLEACYKRERIRQWRWQTFLNGPTIERFVATDDRSKTEFAGKWEEFLSDFDITNARAFKERPAEPDRLMFERKAYRDPLIQKEVFKLLLKLRFECQIQYPRGRTEHDEADKRAPLREHHELAETVARVMLLIALILPIVHMGFVSAEMLNNATVSDGLHVTLFVSALWAAVVSALARAYRAGMTMPEEAESYEDYAAKVETLTAIYRRAKSDDERQSLHEELETESERELRRFLVMKGKASFVA